jgi:hypothetical protein
MPGGFQIDQVERNRGRVRGGALWEFNPQGYLPEMPFRAPIPSGSRPLRLKKTFRIGVLAQVRPPYQQFRLQHYSARATQETLILIDDQKGRPKKK